MRKYGIAVVLVFVLLLAVVASGCMGGGNGNETQTTYESSSGYDRGGSGGNSGETGGGAVGGGGGGAAGSSSGTATASATWESPWDAYNPVEIDGEGYYITYIKYTFTVKTPEGEQTYEVEKKRDYVRTHVYADENGQKKDIGEFNLFAYYEKMTPVGESGAKPFEYVVMVKNRTKETDQWFLNPLPNLGALSGGNSVVVEARYGENYFYWSNPPALGQYSELPYTEGDIGAVLEDLGSYITQAWIAMLGSGAWSGLEGHDLMKKDEYSFSFMGLQYSYKIEPDGTVTLDGKDFRVSKVEWTYSAMGSNLQGKATIAPALPIPIETEGTFVSMSTGTKGYSKIEIEGIKLDRKFGGIEVSIEKPTSPGQGETETQTNTETQTQSGSSENWKLAWDASKPLKINGESYILKGITYNITYKMPGRTVHYTMERGYTKTDDGYRAYAIVRLDDGSEYRFEVYFSGDELEEYTGWVLWMPSTIQLTDSNSPEKVTIEGPSCSYTYDEESGEMSGDMNCGAEIRESPFDQIWDLYNGFAGGIYGDVVDVTSLSESGEGYTVEPAGSVKLAGMDFPAYRVKWSGSIMGTSANGETMVSPELPIPLEITASIAYPGQSLYLHVKVTDMKLEKSS